MNTFVSALIASLSTVGFLGILVFIFKTWLVKRLEYSIKHEYDKKLAQLIHEKEIRQRAELVANLLAEWLAFPGKQKDLNKLTFEAFLWLPDDIAKDLSDLLAHQTGAKDVRGILLAVRKFLLDKDTKLSKRDIIVFTQDIRKKQEEHKLNN